MKIWTVLKRQLLGWMSGRHSNNSFGFFERNIKINLCSRRPSKDLALGFRHHSNNSELSLVLFCRCWDPSQWIGAPNLLYLEKLKKITVENVHFVYLNTHKSISHTLVFMNTLTKSLKILVKYINIKVDSCWPMFSPPFLPKKEHKYC